jgi:hypothetical protein
MVMVQMVNTSIKNSFRAELLAIADAANLTYELIGGIAVPKMSPPVLSLSIYWHNL